VSTVANGDRSFRDLDALLSAMPPGQIDMAEVAAYERRSGRRFADPPEYVERWLLDQ
jgi:hypothetical protein